LRAERADTGDGRVYTITYTVTDASGNSARKIKYKMRGDGFSIHSYNFFQYCSTKMQKREKEPLNKKKHGAIPSPVVT